MSTAVRSHAKINLGLYIGAPRPDGYHALTTVYQTLEMHDVVTVSAWSAASNSIQLTSNNSRVPTDNRNTAWKMVLLALEELGMKARVEIHIEKRLPVQGGLGAGSANAVAALVGLEKELGIVDRALPPIGQQTPDGWGTQRVGLEKELGIGDRALPPIGQNAPDGWGTQMVGLEKELGIVDRALPPIGQRTPDGWGTQMVGAEKELGLASQPVSESASQRVSAAAHLREIAAINWGAKRLEIAAQVGSDVPLFLIGGTVLGLDRGQEVYPLPDLDSVWCVVAVPAVGVSTAQAFKDWDALCVQENLTPEASKDKLDELSRAYASAFSGYIPGGGRGAGSSGVLFDEEDLAARPQETIDESGLVRTGITSWIENDFERVVFPQHPSLGEIKRILAAGGQPEESLHASLSGSGSALFGLYKSRGDAEAAVARVREQARGVEARVTRTLPRAEYWRQMLLE